MLTMSSSVLASSPPTCRKLFGMLFLWISTSAVMSLAGASASVLMDPVSSPLFRTINSNDDLVNLGPWHDSSMESQDHLYPSLPKGKLEDLQLQKMASWREAVDNMKRWLNAHVRQSNLALGKIDDLNNDYHNGPSQAVGAAKRNGGSYMCHFKLCQLGAASNSGKRRLNPSAYD